jgi:hypothetical protein
MFDKKIYEHIFRPIIISEEPSLKNDSPSSMQTEDSRGIVFTPEVISKDGTEPLLSSIRPLFSGQPAPNPSR